MPTENERKYVIRMEAEDLMDDLAHQIYEISQGYLIATRGITVRVRKLIPLLGSKKFPEYYFTMKASTPTVGPSPTRVVEIENKLDQRDFQDLWNIALNKLEKNRYVVKHGKQIWECDFFKDYQGKRYMAVAEAELPEGQLEPTEIPPFIKDNLLYRVALTDGRFSNKLLGDPRYATDLLSEILKK